MGFRDDVKSRMSAFLQRPIDQIVDDAALTSLVSDSFILIEMVMDLQEQFQLRLVQEDLTEVRTVGDLLGVLEKKKG